MVFVLMFPKSSGIVDDIFLLLMFPFGFGSFVVLRGLVFGDWSWSLEGSFQDSMERDYRCSLVYSRLRINKLTSLAIAVGMLGATVEGWEYLWHLLKRIGL